MIGLDALFFDHGGRRARRRTRVVRVVVALLLTALPAAAVVWLHARAAAVRRWPVVACTITESGVDDVGDADGGRDRPYRPAVTFAFTVGGQSQEGHRLWPTASDGRTADAAEAYAVADALPVGAAAACYVDGADPGESVLVRPAAWWEPWAVPAAVAAVAAVVWCYCVPQLRATSVRRPWAGAAAGGLFLAGFGGAVVVWWGVPVARWVASGRWPAVPCVVESSHVQQHREAGEVPVTLYRTDVLYRYAVGGRAYHSNQYSLTECASPAAGGRVAVAAAYPVGWSGVCYVDPADPAVATLTRRLSPTVAFAAGPVVFAAVGGLVLLDGGRGRLLRPVGRWVRLSRWTLTAIAVAVAGWTIWGVFGRP